MAASERESLDLLLGGLLRVNDKSLCQTRLVLGWIAARVLNQRQKGNLRTTFRHLNQKLLENEARHVVEKGSTQSSNNTLKATNQRAIFCENSSYKGSIVDTPYFILFLLIPVRPSF